MTPLLLDLGTHPQLFESLAAGLNAEVGHLNQRRFPDGETYLRFDDDCRGRHVVLVCSLNRPDEKTLPLLLAAATARDLGAVEVGLVAPYLAYMRQDHQFNPGEGISARYYARILSEHFDWLVTVDPHLHRLQALEQIYPIPTGVVQSAPVIAQWVSAQVENPLLIGPDAESEQWVAEVARHARLPFLILEKVRTGDRQVRVSAPELARYPGCTPVVVDDIVSTGRTLIATIEHLAGQELPAPVCVAVHGVFAEDAWDALHAAGAGRVVCSNTLVHESNALDVSVPLTAGVAEKLARGGGW